MSLAAEAKAKHLLPMKTEVWRMLAMRLKAAATTRRATRRRQVQFPSAKYEKLTKSLGTFSIINNKQLTPYLYIHIHQECLYPLLFLFLAKLLRELFPFHCTGQFFFRLMFPFGNGCRSGFVNTGCSNCCCCVSSNN